jgi:uncharacterized OB-fold protein
MTQPKPNFLWPTNRNCSSVKGFWEGLGRRQLLASKCARCDEVFFPPRSHCPGCLGTNLEWTEISNEATLHSWTEVYFARAEFDTPFLLGLVDLAPGIGRLAAKIVGAEAQQLKIGMPVQIVFAEVEEDFSLYCISIGA